MPTAYGGDWQNFQDWLNSPQGWLFWILFVVWISLIPILVVLRRLVRKNNLQRFPGIVLWLGLDLAPLLPLMLLSIRNSGTVGSFLLSVGSIWGIFALASAVPLFVGVIILRWTRRTERLPTILMWLGLGSPPVIVFALIVPWGYFVSAGIFFMSVCAFPLVVGLIVLAFAKPGVHSIDDPFPLCPRCGSRGHYRHDGKVCGRRIGDKDAVYGSRTHRCDCDYPVGEGDTRRGTKNFDES